MEHQNQNREPERGSTVKGPYLCELPRRSERVPERTAERKTVRAESETKPEAAAAPERKTVRAEPEAKPETPAVPAETAVEETPKYSTRSCVLAVVLLHAAAAAVWLLSPITFETVNESFLFWFPVALVLGDLLMILAPVPGGIVLGMFAYFTSIWIWSILEEYTGLLTKISSADAGLLVSIAGYFGLLALGIFFVVISVMIGRRATALGQRIRVQRSARKR